MPLFVSRRWLARRKRLPRAACPWALDSGGFSELHLFGCYETAPQQYIAEIRRFRNEVGRLDWAPCQDWMCEETSRARTGLTVQDHQRRTLESYLLLRDTASELPIIPVLQGWTVEDYLRHVDQYDLAGVALAELPLVGLGSVCRRQHTEELVQIVCRLQPIRLHGFGVKRIGLSRVADLLVSSDSMAWSYEARRQKRRLPGCRHSNCANCWRYASEWRQKVRLTSLFIE